MKVPSYIIPINNKRPQKRSGEQRMLAITFDCDIEKGMKDKLEAILYEQLGEPCKAIPMATGVYRITPRLSTNVFEKIAEKLNDPGKALNKDSEKKSQNGCDNRELVLHALLPFCFGFLAARLLKH